MQLFVVRHGETEENASGVVQGHHHGTLSARGRRQAEQLAMRFREIQFDAIYTSDLGRAVMTAEAIGRFQQARIQRRLLLRERNAGIFQGRSFRDMDLFQEQSGFTHAEFKPEGGESYRDVLVRVVSFLESIRGHADDHRLLIVSHGRWMRMLLSIALKLEIEQSTAIPQTNTG